jgi:hypothetical protein
MRWGVRGLEAATGKWRAALVEAPNESAAKATVTNGGLMQITAAVDSPRRLKTAIPLAVLSISLMILGMWQLRSKNATPQPASAHDVAELPQFSTAQVARMRKLLKETERENICHLWDYRDIDESPTLGSNPFDSSRRLPPPQSQPATRPN